MTEREEYIAPVSFAREPALELRRWIGRILLGLLIVMLAFIVINNVISPPDNSPVPPQTETEGPLPAPI